jgi:hypothetical protein
MQEVGLVLGAKRSRRLTSIKNNKEKEKYPSFYDH